MIAPFSTGNDSDVDMHVTLQKTKADFENNGDDPILDELHFSFCREKAQSHMIVHKDNEKNFHRRPRSRFSFGRHNSEEFQNIHMEPHNLFGDMSLTKMPYVGSTGLTSSTENQSLPVQKLIAGKSQELVSCASRNTEFKNLS